MSTKKIQILNGASIIPKPDWEQNDSTKADYIKNKPTLGTISTKDSIEKTDLSSDVQAAIDKANTAIQSIDGLATETYVDNKVAGVVNSAPETLDTLNELATALGNDANFATTVATQIGTKQQVPLVGTIDTTADDYITPAQVIEATTSGRDVIVTVPSVTSADGSTTFTNVQLTTVATVSNMMVCLSMVADSMCFELIGGISDGWGTPTAYYITTKSNLDSHTQDSTIHMTSAEKNKLAGIASGAQVNVINSIKVNGITMAPSGKTIDITVPTKNSELTNDSGFITGSDIPEGAAASTTVPKAAGTAAVGTELAFARGDHVHPAQTSISGNAGSATKLESARTITLAGDVTGSTSFDGTSDVTIATTIADAHSLGITGATSGQTVRIAAVDEEGLPTTWEAVDMSEPLSGTTNELTPTQVYNAVKAGRDVTLTYSDSTYGTITFNFYGLSETNGAVMSSMIAYSSGIFVVYELVGIVSTNTWSVMSTGIINPDDFNSHVSDSTIHVTEDEKNKLSQMEPPLIGSTSIFASDHVTPAQVIEAVMSGRDVKLKYIDSTYGDLSFTTFNVAESLNTVVANAIVLFNDNYVLAELWGDSSSTTWGYVSTFLAEQTDIPTALKNPNAITFTGAVSGSYDGSSAMTVNIPSAVTIPESLKNPYALTIKTGTEDINYDGSAAKEVTVPCDTKVMTVTAAGAKGDGTTDDTSAFQTALANYRYVYVPAGTYNLSDGLVIRDACKLELSIDAILNFTQTSGNCISMKMSSYLCGNHAVIKVPYSFSGNVIYVSTALNTSVIDVPPFTKWDPQWKTGRYVTDISISKQDSRGFHYSIDGGCSGTAVYIEADGSATSTFIWGLNFSGLRIAGAFSYGIHAKTINSGYNHEMRLEALIDACEIGLCLEDCNNAYASVTVQPRAALTTDSTNVVYAKYGIQLIRSRNTDLSGARVWDWNSNTSLWTSASDCEYQHIAMVGNCSGTILNDFFYYEMPSYDIRSLIYTDTASNLERITILQEPFTRWFKPVNNKPMFYDGSSNNELLLKSEFDSAFQTDVIANFDNLLPKSENADGTIFNDIGYQSGAGWPTDGVTLNTGSEYAQITCTGFMPCSENAVVRLKGISFASGSDYCRVVLFKSDHSKLMHVNRANLIDNKSSYFINNYTETDDGCQFTIVNSAAAYFKINVFTSTLSSSPVVTVNEEITYTQEGFLSDTIKVKGESVVLNSSASVEDLATSVTVLDANVSALDTRVTNNYTDLYDLIMAAASNINALETRVTALEGGGS